MGRTITKIIDNDISNIKNAYIINFDIYISAPDALFFELYHSHEDVKEGISKIKNLRYSKIKPNGILM